MNFRTHLHHIEEWAVYETHDGATMIALCPTCHDAVHHGPLEISDETLSQWKGVPRLAAEQIRDHIYVEPGPPQLLLGTFKVTCPEGIKVLEFGESNRLAFSLEEGDVLLLNLSVAARDGREVLKVIHGHVIGSVPDTIRYERVPGHIRVTAPASPEFIPEWVVPMMREQQPEFAADGDILLLDLEVVEPGLVRVQGVWAEEERAIVITREMMSMLRPGLREPISLIGGPDTQLYRDGPLTGALFDIELPLAMPDSKVGRNDPCPCGSGRKYKRCHGA